MICPNCHKEVRRKERTGNTCGKCGKKFALEPKENPLNLHDVRLLKVAGKLGDNGAYRFTSAQLYYAVTRKTLGRIGRFPVAQFLVALVGIPLLFALGAEVGFLLLAASALTLGWIIYIIVWLSRRNTRRIEPPLTHGAFVKTALDAWRRTYGGDLPGVVREDRVKITGNPERPTLTVFGNDRSTLAGLLANDVQSRYNVALALQPVQVPDGAPVVLLHDVSVEGYAFAAQARQQFGPRVVADLTPRVATVRTAKPAVRLRSAAPSPENLGRLTQTGLVTGTDLDWLAKGWWSPVAAIRPSIMVGRVRAAAERLGDPDRRAAAAVGFLTWPGPA